MTRPKCVQASFASSLSEKKKHSPHLIRQTKNTHLRGRCGVLGGKTDQKSGNNSGGSGGWLPPKTLENPMDFVKG